jgi:hypothetical protein
MEQSPGVQRNKNAVSLSLTEAEYTVMAHAACDVGIEQVCLQLRHFDT